MMNAVQRGLFNRFIRGFAMQPDAAAGRFHWRQSACSEGGDHAGQQIAAASFGQAWVAGLVDAAQAFQ